MKNLPSKGFLHTSGSIIHIPFDPQKDLVPEDHSVFAANNPHLFNSTEEEMKNAAGVDYERLKRGSLAWSSGVQDLLNKKGYMRFTKSTEKKYSGNGREHVMIISTENNSAEPSHFIEPLKTIKSHVNELPKEDSFIVNLTGFKNIKDKDKFLEDRNIKKSAKEGVIIYDMNTLNKYIGEEGGKISRDPIPEPKIPTSTDIRAAIKKPENMSAAEFNFYRTMGDSVEYSIKFDLLLERIKENKILKKIAMRNYTSPIGLLTRDIPKTDEKTLKAISDIPAIKRQKIITQAREKWESDRAASVKRNKQIEKATNLLVGEDDSNSDRYDKIMKLATNKKRANISDVKKYGYPQSNTSFASETMERIASTFERKRQKMLTRSGTGHY